MLFCCFSLQFQIMEESRLIYTDDAMLGSFEGNCAFVSRRLCITIYSWLPAIGPS